jgi:hypothetical protein
MEVTADQVAAMRAFLAGDLEEHKQLYDRLDKTSKTAYLALIEAAFLKAADRRFAKDGSPDDLIEFVGTIRSRSERLGENIDPLVAERLIRAALGEESVDDLDDAIRFGTEVVLLAGLIFDRDLDDAGLDQFLAESRTLADEWLRADAQEMGSGSDR